MKNFWRYRINIESSVLLDDEQLFQKELFSLNWETWYFYPHFYNEDNILKSYWAAIVSLSSIWDLNRVKEIYKIEPTVILSDKQSTVYHLIFDFDIGIPKDDYRVVAESLAKIYWWTAIDAHFYHKNDLYVSIISDKTNSVNFSYAERLSMINLKSILSDDTMERKQIKSDVACIEEINTFSIKKVCKDLWKEDDLVDEILNISPIYWRPYNYILNQFKLPSEAKKWVNETYGMKMVERVDLSKYRWMGEKIVEGNDFMLDDVGYYMIKEGQKMRQTDFFVNVHYRIQKSEKEIVFIVSLVNEVAWFQSNKVEWSNCLGRIAFAEYCQKLGNFHYIGSQTFISLIHSKISEYKDVPIITAVYWYGFHPDQWIAIFENWVFDLNEKIFTPKLDIDDNYYFNYNGRGYIVIDKQGNEINTTFKWLIPSINKENLTTTSELFDIFWKLYNDYSGMLAVIMTLWGIGYSLYAKKWTDETLPFLFVRGNTGSGKSSYMRLIQRMWWVPWEAKHFETTTPFIFSVLLSYLNYCPLFLTEYREWCKDGPSKISTLRAVYDKTGAAKWRADQTVVNYDYKGLPMIDGEEMIQDPATRTRCVQHRFLSSHKIQGDFSTISQEAYPVLDSVLYSYLMLSDWDKYRRYLKEWFEIFSKVSDRSSRIGANLRVVYAGCMAFDDSFKDEYIDVLLRAGQFQDTDVKSNSNYAQIINAISKFIQQVSDFDSSISFSNNNVVISWWPLEDYIKFRKIDLSLKTESYKDHLEENWFKIDYEDVKDRLVYGIIIPLSEVPMEFRMNPKIYEATKIYNQKLKMIS